MVYPFLRRQVSSIPGICFGYMNISKMKSSETNSVWLMVSVLPLTFVKGAVSGKQCSLNVDIRCFPYSNKAGENWTQSESMLG